jgi:hypothetical protein
MRGASSCKFPPHTHVMGSAHHMGKGGDLMKRCSSHRELQTLSRPTGANGNAIHFVLLKSFGFKLAQGHFGSRPLWRVRGKVVTIPI